MKILSFLAQNWGQITEVGKKSNDRTWLKTNMNKHLCLKFHPPPPKKKKIKKNYPHNFNNIFVIMSQIFGEMLMITPVITPLQITIEFMINIKVIFKSIIATVVFMYKWLCLGNEIVWRWNIRNTIYATHLFILKGTIMKYHNEV